MLGHSSISAVPIATSIFDPNVNVTVSGNALTVSVGAAQALAGSVFEVTGNALTINAGTVTIEADANVTPGGIPFTLGAGTVTVEASGANGGYARPPEGGPRHWRVPLHAQPLFSHTSHTGSFEPHYFNHADYI